MELNEVKLVKIDELKPHPKNPRIHPDSALDKLIKSMDKFGFTNPILASKDGIILAGHARCKAAKKAGINKVPVIFLNLEGADADAYLIADNRIQDETSWEKDSLADLMSELKELDYDVSVTGFEAAELEALFGIDVKEDKFDISDELEKNEEPISRQGDLWLLGKHKLLCGSAINLSDVEKLMDGNKANLVITDPPYGVDLDGGQGKIKNDNLKGEDFYKFLYEAFVNMEKAMADDASIYVFHADTKGIYFRRAFEDAGFHLSGVCQWVKNNHVMGRSPYQWKHEPCLFGFKKKGRHRWYSERKETTVWNFDRPAKSKLHSTMKPVPLLAYPMKNSSMVNSIILEPFSGSFSTGIACEQIDRICYAIELEERFVDVGVKRWIEHVGSSEDVYLIRNGEKIKYNDVGKGEKLNV